MLLFNLKLTHHSAIIKILKVEVKVMPDYTECDTCMNFEYDEEFASIVAESILMRMNLRTFLRRIIRSARTIDRAMNIQ